MLINILKLVLVKHNSLYITVKVNTDALYFVARIIKTNRRWLVTGSFAELLIEDESSLVDWRLWASSDSRLADNAVASVDHLCVNFVNVLTITDICDFMYLHSALKITNFSYYKLHTTSSFAYINNRRHIWQFWFLLFLYKFLIASSHTSVTAPEKVLSFSAVICLGDRKGVGPVKSWCWFFSGDYFDWSLARLMAPVVTTTSIILSSNKIQNEDILVPAYPGCTGK